MEHPQGRGLWCYDGLFDIPDSRPLWNTFLSLFSQWRQVIIAILTMFIVAAVVLACCSCCLIPIFRILLERTISSMMPIQESAPLLQDDDADPENEDEYPYAWPDESVSLNDLFKQTEEKSHEHLTSRMPFMTCLLKVESSGMQQSQW